MTMLNRFKIALRIGSSDAAKELASLIESSLSPVGAEVSSDAVASSQQNQVVIAVAHHPLELAELIEKLPAANEQTLRIAICKTWTVNPYTEALNAGIINYATIGAPREQLTSYLNELSQAQVNEAHFVGEVSALSNFNMLLCFSEVEQRILRAHSEEKTPVIVMPMAIADSTTVGDAHRFRTQHGRSAGLLLNAAPENVGICILIALSVEKTSIPVTMLCDARLDISEVQMIVTNAGLKDTIVISESESSSAVVDAITSCHAFVRPVEYLIPNGAFPQQRAMLAIAAGHTAVVDTETRLAEILQLDGIIIDYRSAAEIRAGVQAAFYAPFASSTRTALLTYSPSRFAPTFAKIVATACEEAKIAPQVVAPVANQSPNREPKDLGELFQMVNEELNQKQFERAYALLTRADGIPELSQHLIQARTTVAMSARDWAGAVKFIQQGLALDSSDVNLHWMEANCRVELRDLIGAHEALIRTLALDPNHRAAMLLILQTGGLLNRKQDYEWYLNNYIKNNPNDIELSCQAPH